MERYSVQNHLQLNEFEICNPMSEEEIENQWKLLHSDMSVRFGEGMDMTGILFLIGVQELGKGNVTFSKQEKMDLIHIAICRILSPLGYYKMTGRDKDGWPHWELIAKLPNLSPEPQEIFLKGAIISYFKTDSPEPEAMSFYPQFNTN